MHSRDPSVDQHVASVAELAVEESVDDDAVAANAFAVVAVAFVAVVAVDDDA